MELNTAIEKMSGKILHTVILIWSFGIILAGFYTIFIY